MAGLAGVANGAGRKLGVGGEEVLSALRPARLDSRGPGGPGRACGRPTPRLVSPTPASWDGPAPGRPTATGPGGPPPVAQEASRGRRGGGGVEVGGAPRGAGRPGPRGERGLGPPGSRQADAPRPRRGKRNLARAIIFPEMGPRGRCVRLRCNPSIYLCLRGLLFALIPGGGIGGDTATGCLACSFTTLSFLSFFTTQWTRPT